MKTFNRWILLCFIAAGVTAAETVATNSDKVHIALPGQGVCAHRGAMATHPENTLPAFQEAIRLGVHMIEFDVQMSKDGYLVIMHDSTVDRTTNGTGEVSQLTFEELRQLDAGIKMGEQFEGTIIPTLTETLRVMPENIWLNVHLKGDEELGAKVAQVLADENRLHQAFLACDVKVALAARTNVPAIKTCSMDRQPNDMDYVNIAVESKAQFIQLRGDGTVHPEVIEKLKQCNIRINYYGADLPEILCGLFEAGVDFPLVNDPEPMLNAAYEKMGIAKLKPVYK